VRIGVQKMFGTCAALFPDDATLSNKIAAKK
jgi:hypothetical protein